MAFGQGANAYQQVRSHGGVESADPHGLITLLMDGALERLVTARGHMQRGEIAPKGEVIGRVIEIIGGLRDALDPKVESPLVGQLDALYDYMGRRLLHANLRNDVGALDEVSALLQKVRNSWVMVPPEARRPAGAAA
ncbi:flagellar export chaperone FliS [Frateuria edaphi]|jgi:flagellar protein FliS|uniref:flagellar export chaperone FliS n=1 Tax=Frateuria TaxID=70411 RepID=UPI001E5A17CC|nr:flagellar export chaperone FliS [Frateuria edaphi]UGB46350.1 flagellar export chaperone FliS [Frateuria edaphi]